MSSPKLITVFGATGNQGGSIIKVVLDHPTLSKAYKIRAVTRDTSKPSATALAAKGCETVKADLSDPSSIADAVKDSYAVYAVTNYWELISKDAEYKQGVTIADACVAAGVKHLVWSSLPNTMELTKGALPNIDHFDSKADVEAYIEKHKGDMLATYYMPAFFMSNVKGMINNGPDGVPAYALTLHPTETKHALIDIRADTGKYVMGILEAGEAANGARVQAVSEWTTPQGVTDTITQVSGTKVVFTPLPREVLKGAMLPTMGELAAEEMTQNIELIRDYSYYGPGSEKNQADSDRFLLKGSKLTSFKEYVEKNGPWEWK